MMKQGEQGISFIDNTTCQKYLYNKLKKGSGCLWVDSVSNGNPVTS